MADVSCNEIFKEYLCPEFSEITGDNKVPTFTGRLELIRCYEWLVKLMNVLISMEFEGGF